MTNLFQKVEKFFSYWYVRYLLATELYMVEPWEKAVIHVLFVVLFSLFWYFNYTIIKSGIFQLGSSASSLEEIS